MNRPTALLDACVLYPAPLRDLLMHLAVTELFHAKWSERIHDEWIRSLLLVRPDLTSDQLARTRRLMNENTIDSLVTGYEFLIDRIALPDPDDRHVLAAAMHSVSDCIVTFNLRDFPAEVLQPLGIDAIHPDDFLVKLLRLDSDMFALAVRRHRLSLRNPPKSVAEYLDTLAQQGLPQSVSLLNQLTGSL
ncbi:MAG: PIN domain-containing protein [Planctomycetaceae bacterium]|nr:PIN domain-containing protein [Planctomycetaceae bacterium]